jgi:hypothetical protein
VIAGAGPQGDLPVSCFWESSGQAKPDAGRAYYSSTARRSGTGVFIVHDYAVRGARGAGGWLLIVAYEMALARKLSFLREVTIWIWSGSEGSDAYVSEKAYGIFIVLWVCVCIR